MTPAAPEGSSLHRFLRAAMGFLVFLTVLALFPFIRDPAVDTKILVYTWGAGICALVWVMGHWITRRPLARPRLLPGILLAFFGLFAAATVRSDFVGISLVELNKFLGLFLLYLVAAEVYRGPEQVERLMLITCVAVGLSVVYGIFQHYGLDPFPWNPELSAALREAPGTFGNGNLAAHATILCVIFAVYLALARRRWWCLGFVVLYLTHLELANQRGGVVGLLGALALLVVAWVLYRRLRRPGWTIVLTFAVLTALGAGAVAGVMGIQQLRTGIPYPTGLPVLLRYHGYSGAAQMILKRPLLGYGPGAYRYENPLFWTPFEQEHFATMHRMNYHAHNDVLEIGVETGLPAAGLYLTFLITATAYGLWMGLTDQDTRKRRIGFAFAAFFFAFLIDGLFGFNFRVPVSAMLVFLMAGTLEGVWMGPAPVPAEPDVRRRPSPVIALVVTAAAVAATGFQTVIFASEMLYQRARGAQYYKAYPEAERFLAQGEALAPWNWDFPFQRGEAALRQYRPLDAIRCYERALACNPYFPGVPIALAHAHIMLAEIGSLDQPLAERLRILDQAAEYARKAAGLCAPMPEAQDMLGRVASLRATLLERQPDMAARAGACWKEAEQHFNLAIQYRLKEADRAYVMLARTRVALGDKLGAQDALIRALQTNPANAVAWPVFRQFAQTFGRQEVFREFVLNTEERLRKEGKETAPGLKAVAAGFTQGPKGLAGAAQLLAEAAAAPSKGAGRPQPENFAWAADSLVEQVGNSGLPAGETAVPLYNLGSVYAACELWDQADKLFANCWKSLPANQQVDCALLWGQVLVQSGRSPKAVDVLREAGSRYSGNPRLQLALARILAKMGRSSEARIEYDLLLNRFGLDQRDRSMVQRELESLPAPG